MMSEKKCHLKGNIWYCDEAEGPRCSTSYIQCDHCENYTCYNHSCDFSLCDKCGTLQGVWKDKYLKEMYEKIYINTTKACRS